MRGRVLEDLRALCSLAVLLIRSSRIRTERGVTIAEHRTKPALRRSKAALADQRGKYETRCILFGARTIGASPNW